MSASCDDRSHVFVPLTMIVSISSFVRNVGCPFGSTIPDSLMMRLIFPADNSTGSISLFSPLCVLITTLRTSLPVGCGSSETAVTSPETLECIRNSPSPIN